MQEGTTPGKEEVESRRELILLPPPCHQGKNRYHLQRQLPWLVADIRQHAVYKHTHVANICERQWSLDHEL